MRIKSTVNLNELDSAGSMFTLLIIIFGAFIGFPTDIRVSIAVLFCILFFVIFLLYFAKSLFFSCTIDTVSIILFFYVFFVVSSFLWGGVHGYTFEDWMRSVVGQVILLLFIPISSFAKSDRDIESITLCILYVCLAWCCFSLIKNYNHVIEIVSTGGRLSYYDLEAVMPFPLIGFVIGLFCTSIRLRYRFLCLSVFLMFAIVVGYKVVVFLMFLFIVLKAFISKGSVFLISGAFSLLIILFLFGSEFAIVDFYVKRLSQIGGTGDQSRLKEYVEIINLFLASPIIGAGYGFSIEGLDGELKNYVHSYLLFQLGGGGLIGFILFLGFLLKIILVKSKDERGFALKMALIALFLSSLTAASYKFIQYNLMASVLAALCYSSRKKP